jgi:MYXO-CTERM domain-containing protein
MRQAGERILQAAADANGYLLAWSTETEVASRQLFMARLDRDGGVVGAPRQLDGDPGELVTRPGGFWQRSGGSVQALDASGAPVGDWQDYTMQRFAMRGDVALGVHSESNVAYGQRFTVGGAVDASRVPLATGVDSANGQLAVAGGDGGWLVAWCEGGTIVFERVGVDGRPLDAPARTASIAPSVCEAPPTIVFAGGAFHLFWVSAIRSTTDRIWSMRITGAGTASAPALVARREWSGGTVAAAVVGSSIAVLAHDGYIVLARVGLDGTPVAGQFDGDARDAWLLPASGGRALLLEAVDHDIGGDLRPRIFRRFLTPVAAGACDIGFECASGVCADGVCCDRTCGAGAGDCQACSVAAGAARDGVCGVVATGIECRASDGACGAAEVCDGVATACPADTGADDGATCDDGVVCTSGDVCTAGVCAGRAVECPTSECTVAACDFSTGACVTTQVPPGTPCTGGFCHGGQCQVADAGVPDAGMPDAGVPDAGLAPDARPPTVPTRPTTDDDGGCGCRSGRPDGSVAALLLALGFLARRRRGRAAA